MSKAKKPTSKDTSTAEKIKKGAAKAKPSQVYTDLQGAQAHEYGGSVQCAKDESEPVEDTGAD